MLFVDKETCVNKLRIEKRIEQPNECLNEFNFTQVTDDFEKVEIEFDYKDYDQADQDNSFQDCILKSVHKHGDIGPNTSHYDTKNVN